jgi:hypothetical protein
MNILLTDWGYGVLEVQNIDMMWDSSRKQHVKWMHIDILTLSLSNTAINADLGFEELFEMWSLNFSCDCSVGQKFCGCPLRLF